MKELIQNWFALPSLLWKTFLLLFDFFWEDHKLKKLPKALLAMLTYIFRSIGKYGRSTSHSCVSCKYFIKQPSVFVNWNKVLKTDNILLKNIPTQVDTGLCLLNNAVTLNSACSRWNDSSSLSSTEEERILNHNW